MGGKVRSNLSPLANQLKLAITAFLIVLGLYEWDVSVKHLRNHGFEHGFHIFDECTVSQEVGISIGVIFLDCGAIQAEFDIVCIFESMDGTCHLVGRKRVVFLEIHVFV